uniref:Odorant receptor n=1 Tax=Ostrinia furnacalis TaxID=93504 RepID=A0A0E4B599_OSTFU|nr:putative olfactory receptor 16 [Ostrinia furnacalis]
MSLWSTIRKFGLGYCDLPTMLWNVSFMLRALTLNIDSRYKKRIPLIFYIIFALVAASYFYIYLISMAWFVFWHSRETGDLVAAMVVASLGISSEIGTAKLIYMFLYRNKVRELVDMYLDCDALVKPGSRFANNLTKTLRNVKKRAMIFWIVIMGNGVVYVLKPLLISGRHIMEDLFTPYGFDPVYESPNYEIVFLLMTAGVLFTCYLPANITAFLIIITGYTEGQMLALSKEMLNLWSDAQQFYLDHRTFDLDTTRPVVTLDSEQITKKKIVNEYVKKRLHEMIKIHTTNINLLNHVERVYRGAIAIEFGILVLGLIFELLGGLENTYLEVPFALMQVAMDCLTGQRVMDASKAFEDAVYDCKWENFDVANMKTILLMLQNSQKTMRLSAGGVTTLSFSSLMMVFRSVYSAYTTLRTTMNK